VPSRDRALPGSGRCRRDARHRGVPVETAPRSDPYLEHIARRLGANPLSTVLEQQPLPRADHAIVAASHPLVDRPVRARSRWSPAPPQSSQQSPSNRPINGRRTDASFASVDRSMRTQSVFLAECAHGAALASQCVLDRLPNSPAALRRLRVELLIRQAEQ
jgi:hypothetical protein